MLPSLLIILLIGLVFGLIIGMFLESGRTKRIRSDLINERRAREKTYQDQVKALEKDLKKLKGELGMK